MLGWSVVHAKRHSAPPSQSPPKSPHTTHHQEADAIVLVYDASRRETYDRLSSHWLPLIERTLGIQPPLSASQEKVVVEEEGASSAPRGEPQRFPKPVVLAANKVRGFGWVS